MGRAEDSGVSREDAERLERWLEAFRALRPTDENAWRMFPDDVHHHRYAAITFINIVRLNNEDLVRRAAMTFPSFTSDALVRLARKLRIEVVKMRLD